jgi:uncharacterized protein (TIGR03067 family)
MQIDGRMIEIDDGQRLQGTWDIVSEEARGKVMKPEPLAVTFEGDLVTSTAIPNEKSIFWVDPHNKLPTLTLVQKGDKEITAVFLYQLKKDVLRVCVSDDDGSSPPLAFDSKDGRRILSFRRR